MICTKNLDKAAIITANKKYSYREMFAHIHSYAKLFAGREFKRIAIFAENREEWIFSFYAGWQNGCTVIPIDYLSTADDVAFLLDDSTPDLIFTSKGQVEVLQDAIGKCTHKPEVYNFDEVTLTLDDSIEVEWSVPTNNQDACVIIYTSGTTGSPKGVMLSYESIQVNHFGVTGGMKTPIYKEYSQTLLLLPLHHIFPLGGSMIIPLGSGGTIVMSPSMQSTDMMETLKNNKVNVMIGVPRLYELMYKGIKAKIDATAAGRFMFALVNATKSRKLARIVFKKIHEGLGGNIEVMVAGGAALPPEVGEFWYRLGVDILEGYGMTESAPMITFTRPGAIRVGSPGTAMHGVEIAIRDGEICAKGKNIMKGYYNRPEETADVLKDGWLYTGDLGHVDKDGYLYVTGRKKEIIVLGNGKNINPVELENKLSVSYDTIKEVGVVLHKDLLHAVISPNYSKLNELGVKDVDAHFKNEVLALFNQSVSSYKRIMKFTITKQDLPRTRLQKIQRFRLEELIQQPLVKEKQKSEEPDSQEYLAVKNFIESQADVEVSPEDHIEFDIALDSLAKLSLIDFIEKSFGVKIEEENLLRFPSVKEMVEHIKSNKLFHRDESINWADTLRERVNITLPKTWPTTNGIRIVGKLLLKTFFTLKGKGRENVPEGACIIAPNHQSFMDGLIVASYLDNRTMTDTYFYAKKDHVKGKVARFLADRNNVIVMDLQKELKESIQKLAEVLRQGKKIIIFPEGTRTHDGNVNSFKSTFAILSRELNVPIVPVVIDGAYDANPRGSKRLRLFKKITVKFLKPVEPKGEEASDLSKKIHTIISEQLEKKN